jgi:hypothetical protein
MVLYGCTELEKNITFSKVLHNCKGSRYSLYSWAKDAPSLELPINVGFPVGQEDNPIKYLGVSIHYADPSSEPDFSGFIINLKFSFRMRFFCKNWWKLESLKTSNAIRLSSTRRVKRSIYCIQRLQNNMAEWLV